MFGMLAMFMGIKAVGEITEKVEQHKAMQENARRNELIDNNCKKAMQANDEIRYVVEYSKDGEVLSIKASENILANIFDDYSVEVISVKGC